MILEEKAKKLANLVPLRKDIPFQDYIRIQLASMYYTGAVENGIIWHDMLKDPEDLPDKGRVAFSHVVMTDGGFRKYCNTFTGKWFAAGTFELVDKPRAWCEIPKFEEVDI